MGEAASAATIIMPVSNGARFVVAALESLLAQTFRDSGLDILSLLRAIFRSEEFWSPAARGALVRSPLEWMVASMQALDLTTATAVPQAWVLRIGQAPWGQPDVSGWKANDYWISTSHAWARSGFARATRAALEAMCVRAKREGHPWSIAPNMALLVMLSPDFLLA